MTAPSEAPCVLGEVGHAPASPLASVQQCLRKISAQSLSGFSDPGTPHSVAGARPDYLRNASFVRAPAALLWESHGPAPQPDSGGGDVHWGREGERQGSAPSKFFLPARTFITLQHFLTPPHFLPSMLSHASAFPAELSAALSGLFVYLHLAVILAGRLTVHSAITNVCAYLHTQTWPTVSALHIS